MTADTNSRPTFLETLDLRPLVFDGAMGTMLYEQGYFINRAFDEANLAKPDTVRKIHEAHKKAGAEVLEHCGESPPDVAVLEVFLEPPGVPEAARNAPDLILMDFSKILNRFWHGFWI